MDQNCKPFKTFDELKQLLMRNRCSSSNSSGSQPIPPLLIFRGTVILHVDQRGHAQKRRRFRSITDQRCDQRKSLLNTKCVSSLSPHLSVRACCVQTEHTRSERKVNVAQHQPESREFGSSHRRYTDHKRHYWPQRCFLKVAFFTASMN